MPPELRYSVAVLHRRITNILALSKYVWRLLCTRFLRRWWELPPFMLRAASRCPGCFPRKQNDTIAARQRDRIVFLLHRNVLPNVSSVSFGIITDTD